jgi:drug/metabolite transporter (DMT)-like permease
VPALTVVELRLAIATLLLGAWLLARRRGAFRVRREDWGYFVVLGVVGVSAVQATYYYSISKLGVGIAILLQYLAPSLIVVYDAMRGQRVRASTAWAVVAALAGTALLVGSVDRIALQAKPLHWAIGFASAIVFAFYVVFSKRGLRRYPPETVLFYTFLLASIVWACVTPPQAIVAAGYSAQLWLLFISLGVFSTLVPFALFYAGLRRVPAAEAGVVATIEPVVAVLAAMAFLDERLLPLQWLGALFVLAASVIASRGAPEAIEAQAERG